VAAIEEEEVGDDVERGVLVFLQQAVDDLRPDVLPIVREDVAV
jgi:hypothetical protein